MKKLKRKIKKENEAREKEVKLTLKELTPYFSRSFKIDENTYFIGSKIN